MPPETDDETMVLDLSNTLVLSFSRAFSSTSAMYGLRYGMVDRYPKTASETSIELTMNQRG